MFVVKHKTVVSHVEQLTAHTLGLAFAQTCYVGGNEKPRRREMRKMVFNYNVFISAVQKNLCNKRPQVTCTGETHEINRMFL